MSFLNQLRSQAGALAREQQQNAQQIEENTARCEAASRVVQHYFDELALQLTVIGPDAPPFSLDGKTPWPPMRLAAFRADARKKMLGGVEVQDFIGIGWDVVPRTGESIGGLVRVDFPPDLQRVESRLALGLVQHERKEERHPQKNTLLAYRYEYITRTRGNVTVTVDHEHGRMHVRLVNVAGFGVANHAFRAEDVTGSLLDELAKLIVSQPNTFPA